MKRNIKIVLGISFLFLATRLFFIESIPGEWFGDISNVHEYVTEVLDGKWPFYFFQSPGPLYHYLITPIVMFSKNHGFETYKIASIMVSFLSLAAIFYFVKEISGKRLAYITCLILSTAYLHLIWSRLGNSQIAIPLLSAITGYYTVKYLKKKRFRDALLAGVSASSGWYLYPQTFILPFSFFIFYFVLFLFSRKTKSLLEPAIILFLMFLIFLPFLSIVKRQPDNFGPEGYVGQKVIPGFYMKPAEIIKTMLNRYLKIAGMFHLVGDDTFRINVVRKPHLDKISGIFFLAGFIYFLRKKRIK